MKLIIALALVLAGTLVPGTAAEAKPARTAKVTLTKPSARQVGKVVVVSGKVKGRTKFVRIEQRRGGRWVLVRRAAVKSGSYKVRAKVATPTRLRARVAGKASRRVVITRIKVKPVPIKSVPSTPVAPVVVEPVQPVTDACGTLVKKADGTTWACTLNEDFDGTTLNRSIWMPQTNFAMGTQAAHVCYTDDASTINVSGGNLNLSMRKVTTPVSCTFGGMSGPTNYVSGGVMSYRLFSQQYGRFEARIKNTATTYPGLHEAFWLWPDDRVASDTLWPFAGEIDISETYSSYANLSIPFLHYSDDVYGNLPGVNTAWNCAAARGTYNTYTLEWTPTKVAIYVNGKHCLTNTTGNSAFAKPYIMALTQGMGAAGNVYDGRAPLGTMNVDYVKVWK